MGPVQSAPPSRQGADDVRQPGEANVFALYLGCTVPVRAMNYELAARRTAERLGIEFVDVDGFTCCGYPAKPLSWEAA
ncbi:MAG: heterodisulfide reductase-related iron-sulfur binding cluster, partial [Anaerolineae bacterium]